MVIIPGACEPCGTHQKHQHGRTACLETRTQQFQFQSGNLLEAVGGTNTDVQTLETTSGLPSRTSSSNESEKSPTTREWTDTCHDRRDVLANSTRRQLASQQQDSVCCLTAAHPRLVEISTAGSSTSSRTVRGHTRNTPSIQDERQVSNASLTTTLESLELPVFPAIRISSHLDPLAASRKQLTVHLPCLVARLNSDI